MIAAGIPTVWRPREVTFFGVWELIFCSVCLIGSAGFLVPTSCNRSPKQVPFRRAALLLGSGASVLSAVAVIVVLGGQTAASETTKKAENWLLVPVFVVLVSGLFLLWKGRRTALRPAGTWRYPWLGLGVIAFLQVTVLLRSL